MSYWLVTGGAGFIGSHIAETLVRRKQKVRILDNLSTGKLEHLQSIRGHFDFIKGDIREPRVAQKALKGIDFVLHQAAVRSVVRSLDFPLLTNDVNVHGTLVLLQESVRAKVKRFVYASSSSVYGISKQFPQSPLQQPYPISPYAVSKFSSENYARAFSASMGLQTVSLRYFNVIGPRMDPKSKYALVIPIFMKAFYEGKTITIHGNGKQSRDFCYIDNVVDANIRAATKPNVSGEIFNVACGETHSLLDYVHLLENCAGRKAKLVFAPTRVGDVYKTWADIRLTQKKLGYKPLVYFDEGIKKLWTLYSKENRKQ